MAILTALAMVRMLCSGGRRNGVLGTRARHRNNMLRSVGFWDSIGYLSIAVRVFISVARIAIAVRRW